MNRRASGVLLHITSLPGEYGIGTLGQAAYDFVDFLAEAQQTYWQILPLTTTSYGDSPYQSFSAEAGNTHLIDLEMLVSEGLLTQSDIDAVPLQSNPEKIDYALLFIEKNKLLAKAVTCFLTHKKNAILFESFEKENPWLQDYAEFMAIKSHFDHCALQEWPDVAAVLRHPDRLAYYRELLVEQIVHYKVTQYFFFRQWHALKTYANQKGIRIIGDIPIYVSADSVEVWTMPELFKVNDKREPLFIAGCPPDGFSEDGQLWGNPIYNWDAHAQTGYAWWISRIRNCFQLYDMLRLDHFKGFSDYWEIPGDHTTARFGKWVPGPGYALFKAVKEALGDLPIIAEDLGNIDDKARQLLADTGFPGMKVLMFGFYDVTGQSIDSPHRCVPNSVAYTGTHDNEVVNGWYGNLSTEQQAYVQAYTHRKADETITQAMLRVLFATSSDLVIATMQDILDKGADSRMNRPSTVGGNWDWRLLKSDMTTDKIAYLTYLTKLYQRGRTS